MGRIVILDENTSNQIAAGEVVERPASVVKELVENSIDAGSTNISVEISNGGISLIKVVDNGAGFEEDDMEIAFERHSTSKIRKASDLEAITTLGFRGEALASIASVSTVELTSRQAKNTYGRHVKFKGGTLIESGQVGCPVGTTFVVRELFYNTPARFKFLKKDSTEAGYVSDIVSRIALGNPHISLRLINNRNTVIHTPGNNDVLSTIFSLYGKETAKDCMEISYSDEKIKIKGYAGRPEIARSNRNYQSIYLNGRYIKNKVISSAIDEAYKTFLLKNKHAFIVLYMELNPMLVDVNVHPTKTEVRFSQEQDIFRAVYHAVNNTLLGKSHVRSIELGENQKHYFRFEGDVKSKGDFVQQKLNTANRKNDGVETSRRTTESTLEKRDVVEKDNNYSNARVEDKTGEVLINKGLIREEIKDRKLSGEGYIKKDLSGDNIKSEGIDSKDILDGNLKSEGIDSKDILDGNLKSEGIDSKDILDGNLKSEDLTGEDLSAQENISKDLSRRGIDLKEGEALGQDTETIFQDAIIIGQAFSTYILLQKDEDLILIDQHAAHERIMFETLKEKYLKKENLAQYLLASEVIELTNQELGFIEEEKDLLNKLGFNFETFGNTSIILRSVPVDIDGGGIKEAFMGIVDFLMSKGNKGDSIIEEEALYQIACKSAIKANKRLDEKEIKELLQELEELENPYTCPHGRPTIIKITRYEFEKMFKRVL
ncbi:MAG: DNA mismatch repair endonuclease MutL [Clostridium sp.]|nr:DNA mismatch repair endonuclease MutL [Clostridium sp.]